MGVYYFKNHNPTFTVSLNNCNLWQPYYNWYSLLVYMHTCNDKQKEVEIYPSSLFAFARIALDTTQGEGEPISKGLSRLHIVFNIQRAFNQMKCPYLSIIEYNYYYSNSMQ